jgi:hypothetical protein
MTAAEVRNYTWIALILPFMEQQPLHDQINFAIPAWNQQVAAGSGGSTMNLQAVQLDAFTCPSEPVTECVPHGFGLTSYAGNAGVDGHRRMWGEPNRAGPFTLYDSAKFAKVRDGTSNTIHVGEVSMSSYSRPAGVSQWQGGGGVVRQGTGRVVRSLLVAPAAWHGASHSWVSPPNGPGPLYYADGSGAGGIWGPWSSNYVMTPVYYYQWAVNCDWPGPGSFHPGGAQFCLMDASVRFVAETIDTGTGDTYGRYGNIWAAVHTMAGHQDQTQVSW